MDEAVEDFLGCGIAATEIDIRGVVIEKNAERIREQGDSDKDKPVHYLFVFGFSVFILILVEVIVTYWKVERKG